MSKKWAILREMRKNFLQLEPNSTKDYWQSEEALLAYDETFARRIRWKWDAVLDELVNRLKVLPQGRILDYGCGTAVASEAFTDVITKFSQNPMDENFDQLAPINSAPNIITSQTSPKTSPETSPQTRPQISFPKNIKNLNDTDFLTEGNSGKRHLLHASQSAAIPGRQSINFVLYDRSSRAMAYGSKKLKKLNMAVTTTNHLADESYQVVLVSHVLTELDDASFQEFLKVLSRSKFFIIVDAGIPSVSKRMSSIREHFLEKSWSIVAPCTHTMACPLREAEKDWCHFHVAPDGSVYTDGFWAEFGSEMGIDIRSLSTSYLVMSQSHFELPEGKRLIGLPKSTKLGIKAFLCGANGCVAEDLRLSKSEGKSILKRPFSKIFPG